jgi:methionyl-tRNA formyltransferase
MSSSLRIAVLGNSRITSSIVSALVDCSTPPIAIISKPSQLRAVNSIDLAETADSLESEYKEFESLESAEALSYLRDGNFDYIISNWPDIISRNVISCAKRCIIGSHPTALPKNRGRHPLHWMIVLGLRDSCVTLYEMDEKPDNGPILSQTPFSLPEASDIQTALQIVEKSYNSAIFNTIQKIINNSLASQPQVGEINYWRKRTPHDSLIDPRMSADFIVRTVRSMTKPFPGAEIIVGGIKYTIVSAVEILTYDNLSNYEYGFVLDISGDTISFQTPTNPVKLRLSDPVQDTGCKYVYPPTYYLNSKLSLL